MLVELFLRGHNESTGSRYEVREWPDQVQSRMKAVEAVACDRGGRSLAIEHTLLQPFEGQKDGDLSFLAVFGDLENDPALVVPNCMIDVHPLFGAAPKGPNWKQAGKQVYEWFKSARQTLPEGVSEHRVPNLAFPLNLHIEKTSIDG